MPGSIHGDEPHQRELLDPPPRSQGELVERPPRHDPSHAVTDKHELTPRPQHPLLERPQLLRQINPIEAGAPMQVIKEQDIKLDRRRAESIDDRLQVGRVAFPTVHQDPGRALRVKVGRAAAQRIQGAAVARKEQAVLVEPADVPVEHPTVRRRRYAHGLNTSGTLRTARCYRHGNGQQQDEKESSLNNARAQLEHEHSSSRDAGDERGTLAVVREWLRLRPEEAFADR